MDEEFLAACRRLIQDGVPPSVPAALEGAARFVPIGVDVDGDVAAVSLMMRRPVGASDGPPGIGVWTFHRNAGEWVLLGGGWRPLDEYPLIDRPSRRDLRGSYVRIYGWCSTARDAGRRFPWGAKFVRAASLQTSAEVSQIQVGDRRLLVPFHGEVIVVWSTRRAPSAISLDSQGRSLTPIDLNCPPAYASSWLAAWWWHRRVRNRGGRRTNPTGH
ncbi:hypothetical protein [Actinopolymorpha rutila]|uniref:Uncharacterized protein n=1 Tax=Actinopolymorpha rutila TaxID=446787 RepID=A0A852ZIP6_9ACTN|nr:hypothetical protein [Actinopolymorpha rutila]NYH92927.1 hypothetical protein [Actinopolymorpha rutila]